MLQVSKFGVCSGMNKGFKKAAVCGLDSHTKGFVLRTLIDLVLVTNMLHDRQ